MAAMPETAAKPEGNQLQLPAAFIIDSDGTVLYADYAKTMDGLPSVEELSALLGREPFLRSAEDETAANSRKRRQ